MTKSSTPAAVFTQTGTAQTVEFTPGVTKSDTPQMAWTRVGDNQTATMRP